MRKANVLGAVFFLFWISGPIFSHHHMDHFKPEGDPDGFGGIQWETELSTLQDMKLSRVDPSYGGIDIYLRAGNAGRIGKVEPKNVEYLFWKGKFTGISIIAEGGSDCESLREVVFEVFGKGKKPYAEQDYFVWDGKIILMSLEFFQDGKGALFRMIYKPILYRMEWGGKKVRVLGPYELNCAQNGNKILVTNWGRNPKHLPARSPALRDEGRRNPGKASSRTNSKQSQMTKS